MVSPNFGACIVGINIQVFDVRVTFLNCLLLGSLCYHSIDWVEVLILHLDVTRHNKNFKVHSRTGKKVLSQFKLTC